jgi:undecaprenyl-diphosphatase
MTAAQTLFMAFLQGATELFPVSSLGHAVLVPALLNWQLSLLNGAFLPFLVLLHFGTGIALLVYFRRDWLELGAGVLGRGDNPARDRRLVLLLALGTLPAVVIGAALHDPLRQIFGTPVIAAALLIVNGFVLIYGEKLRRAAGNGDLANLTRLQSALIGLAQCLALLPGMSRSGVTIVAGLRAGLTQAAAARFSFLLATPIILAAAAHELPKIHITGLLVAAGVVAGVTAYATVAGLMHYFGRQEFKALRPFGIYCLVAGLGSLLWLSL